MLRKAIGAPAPTASPAKPLDKALVFGKPHFFPVKWAVRCFFCLLRVLNRILYLRILKLSPLFNQQNFPSTCYRSAAGYYSSGSLQGGQGRPTSMTRKFMMFLSAPVSILPRNYPQTRQRVATDRGQWSSLVSHSFLWMQLVKCQSPRVPKTDTSCRKRQRRPGPVSSP